MINDLLGAFILGMTGGAIPGPILTSIFTEILQSGLAKSFRIIFIGMATEIVIAAICLIALGSLNLPESIFRFVSLIGAGILLWLSFSVWKIKKIDTQKRVHFSKKKIMMMIFGNGGLWIFWITIGVPRAIFLSKQSVFGGVMFLIFLELGWLFSTSALAYVFSYFRKWLSEPHIIPIMFKLFALAFVYFAVSSIYQSLLFFF